MTSPAVASLPPTANAAAADTPDVLVIGGGPAGCAAAIVLAQRGWRVTVLEKDHHPRFHIGESLLPMNMPILQRLGVLEQVRAIGVLKLGADFPNDAGGYNTFRFAHALGAQSDFALQVPRADFDRVLFAQARAVGADVHEGVRVEAVQLDGDTPTVQARSADGVRHYRPRYLIDASGRDTFLGNKLKLKRSNPRHQSAALFSHFRGVARRPGEDAGNISIYRHAHGWMWLIPLPDDVMSVGAVCDPEYMKTRQGCDSEAFLLRTLALNPDVVERMAGAQRVAPVHATGNYAYECTRMSGPRWLMLGDAYAFVDPMFSSGVYLAMHSAERGAAMVDAVLREPASEARLQRRLERHLRGGLDEFKWFIYRFTSPTMRELFAQPRNVLQVEQAVVAMLAGDVFDNRAVLRRLRVFRAIYALSAVAMLPRAWRAWRHRRRQARESFHGDTLHGDTP
ncbi:MULTISPECIES: NAD(P)/FAD-dependent oxidoreductase [unclassified Xanthomonas]|uniref:NAD(P)/FAD-dependent oxidoreductase n=1 Tax=Xanthomonas sp. LMG 9002 TaxID=1591158 RepID=UPI0019293603|nr:NAD(P)/FAD-dependent oxidoreductase [Xanthomonas sp. LMG 9002]MXV09089.1 NAD(P)/FAD-dependent oxidoreductase [Xanthomonas sp. LMG 9002]